MTVSDTFTEEQLDFLLYAIDSYGPGAELDQEQVKKLSEAPGIKFPFWFVDKKYRSGRNKYKIPEVDITRNMKIEDIDSVIADEIAPWETTTKPVNDHTLKDFIPSKMPGYVPHGFFDDVKIIIESGDFLPIFVSGWSGNGKTTMVEQACHAAGRECIVANISPETDQSDLIGGPTLIDGNVVNRDGPVILAMHRGAVLLLDEIDRGSNKLLCLQTILEGKPYLNKQTNTLITPKKGFNIIATANTKGKGSDDGRYLSSILDDAFLERFPITLEQNFPDIKTEKKILLNLAKISGISDNDFIDTLIRWSDKIRKSANEGIIDEIISTRRLCHILYVYSIFKDKKKSIQYCISRFDVSIQKSFWEFYTLLDSTISV